MEYALFALPIPADKLKGARAFLSELERERKQDYAASERRLGISKEIWAIQHTQGGDLFAVFFQSENLAGSVGQFVASQHAFDLWFKAQVKGATGVDLNVPPSGPFSEVLSVYEA